MNEPEQWKTERKCPKCSDTKELAYLWSQPWGKDENGKELYKLTCHVCGHSDPLSHWSGRWTSPAD